MADGLTGAEGARLVVADPLPQAASAAITAADSATRARPRPLGGRARRTSATTGLGARSWPIGATSLVPFRRCEVMLTGRGQDWPRM